MLPLWAVAARRTARSLSAQQVPLLSLGAAFCFAIQMFNVPAVGGTTAHAVGATLLAILLGPWAALLAVTLTLGVQALFFGDGGVLALGANSFNMGFVAAFTGYGVYRLLAGRSELGSGRALLAAGAGAYLGSVLSAASTGMMLGIQPLVAQDESGRALYFPFGASVSVPAMVHIHLLVAGPVEAVVTVAALAYLWRNFPELVSGRRVVRADKPVRLWLVFALVLLLTPLGLIATGSAWGEWDEETLQQLVGYVPAGILRLGEGVLKPLIPDYALPGREGRFWEVVGYIFSAAVGATVTAWIARALVRQPAPVPAESTVRSQPASALPDWMRRQEPSVSMSPVSPRGRWLERTLLQLREVVASAVAAEEWARLPGYLQQLHPLAKTLALLATLVAVSLSRSLVLPFAVLLGSIVLIVVSRLPVRGFLLRALAPILLFGGLVALPLTLQAVTPGRVLWQPFGWEALALSREGALAALMLLLRLSAAVTATLLWSLTTRWHLLLHSLRTLRVPRLMVTGLMLTYRYLFTLVETLAEMVLARRSRQVGAVTAQQARGYAGVSAAVLLAKSLSLQEEVYRAMRARGFDGNLRGAYTQRWLWRDTVWLLLVALWLSLAYWFGGTNVG
ncbi:MAG: cobalt transporter CbiM [Armatimonadota bacterium]|nr:cobalt transporter CbiM [Armatimonadota bacterium]